ncbi:MAG: plastocyanin/azurin family copper-binding protein [Pseudomonadales bacterium]|jgi:plastocyanin|nr:plastocyanin/azurin family copper-binding protein [Pseudomonadales bacterium]MDP7594028.1 plastocyanin/azurin family copper-binding protein [Pseudomonadales bacterium]HJN53335.1 plastocyanin/azurin family copper-binding protein [Pseudomonadales bacterium]|tara:strand:+ start:1458 stop:1901 length:444 start_codon:yes stop_codon:yes gene_type:complete
MYHSSLLSVIAGMLLVAVATHVQGKPADEIAAICAVAEERHQAIYDQRSSDADVAVVLMHKHTFCPSDRQIVAGSTVRWINVDKRTSHSVWFKAAAKPESERLFPEEVVEMSFPEPGGYPYLCGPHWESEGMRGRLEVLKPAGGLSP